MKYITGLLLLAFLLGGCDQKSDVGTTEKKAYPPVHLKMASSYPSSLGLLGAGGKRVEKQIKLISNGNVTIRFFEPGALVPNLEIFDAVSYGALDAGWSAPGLWSGKVPSLQLFSAVPFGPNAPEYLAWFYEGGGREIFDEIYARHNIHSLICGLSPPEASGWFREEIKGLDDLKGMKIRFYGLGARVLSKLGVSTQLLATGDIFPALELGTIDATEFSIPSIDLQMGFSQLAKHYYFPGWHQQATFFELMINLDKWNSMSPTQQAQIESVCADNIKYTLARGEAEQADALEELKRQGVQFHKWPDDIMQALDSAWQDVVREETAKDPDFKRAWDSLSAFRAKYKIWKELGNLD
ncbi:TRAP transporter substrate-binding protein [Emcibacter nanhaiensis]|uniref:TRAP transporter substrate-binding protein n=1 Tax=Emcibacter nanhaiensis TaxID=1505037 RepID=A0A501PRD0_9PROT|nr:TRAP transporter substrate-binding protein [Emcibacter nanhaiensis]TPD62805.1 TRAP transporter substrate-binding protein [Emcibacter nanhaiensis]